MKKIIVLFTALALVAVSASAIDFHVGVKAGGSLALGAGSKPVDFVDARLGWGFVGGVAADIGILDFLAVELDVFYSGMNNVGYNSDGSNILLGGPFNWVMQSVSMIEIPVLVKGSFDLGPGSLFLSAGGDFFIMLGDNPAIIQDANKIDDSILPNYTNTFLYGIAAGLGYSFSLGTGTLSVELRYKLSLNYFWEKGGNILNDNGLQGFDLIIGYYFL